MEEARDVQDPDPPHRDGHRRRDHRDEPAPLDLPPLQHAVHARSGSAPAESGDPPKRAGGIPEYDPGDTRSPDR
ncbi:hypothetical protein GCM10009836_15380 [Pseudonocardia ailaonensis]|uniref:Uncharacterized protein n=1 Tax=Pseudonocardia ailaonensis TaxID=367279 RepID=A0ABN2MSS9_9PSEU